MIQLSDIYIVRHCEAAKRLAEAIQSFIWQQSFYVGEVQNDGLDCFVAQSAPRNDGAIQW